MPLYHVNFLALAKKAMDANPDKRLNIEMMRRLWRMLIDVVYAFDDESARTAKLLEVSFTRWMCGVVSGGLDTLGRYCDER